MGVALMVLIGKACPVPSDSGKFCVRHVFFFFFCFFFFRQVVAAECVQQL